MINIPYNQRTITRLKQKNIRFILYCALLVLSLLNQKTLLCSRKKQKLAKVDSGQWRFF